MRNLEAVHWTHVQYGKLRFLYALRQWLRGHRELLPGGYRDRRWVFCGPRRFGLELATLLSHVLADDLRQPQRSGAGVVAIGEHEVKIAPALAALAQRQRFEYA